ncbi:hypothetical protein BJ973_002950 [Actinoplanes tereljensis]
MMCCRAHDRKVELRKGALWAPLRHSVAAKCRSDPLGPLRTAATSQSKSSGVPPCFKVPCGTLRSTRRPMGESSRLAHLPSPPDSVSSDDHQPGIRLKQIRARGISAAGTDRSPRADGRAMPAAIQRFCPKHDRRGSEPVAASVGDPDAAPGSWYVRSEASGPDATNRADPRAGGQPVPQPRLHRPAFGGDRVSVTEQAVPGGDRLTASQVAATVQSFAPARQDRNDTSEIPAPIHHSPQPASTRIAANPYTRSWLVQFVDGFPAVASRSGRSRAVQRGGVGGSK